MINKIINMIMSNIENIIAFGITIAVIMQRTKINRKVKEMNKSILNQLSIEELELELEKRKKLAAKEVNIEPELESHEILLKNELKEASEMIITYKDTYNKIKKAITLLKNNRDKYIYQDIVEEILEEEMK